MAQLVHLREGLLYPKIHFARPPRSQKGRRSSFSPDIRERPPNFNGWTLIARKMPRFETENVGTRVGTSNLAHAMPPGLKFSLVFLFIGGRARDDFAQPQMGMSCLDEGRQKHFRLQHTRAAPRTTFGEYVRTKRSTASQKETRRQRPAAIRQHPAGTTALRGGRNTYGSKFDPYRMDHYGLTLLHFAAQLIVQQRYWPP
jgi:hypothetical protein